MKKLFLVPLGYYDELSNGVFESHTNLFVVADDFASARIETKNKAVVKEKRMHIDGLQEIEQVDGYAIELTPSGTSDTLIRSRNFRELAPKDPKK